MPWLNNGGPSMFDYLILSACLWATAPDWTGDARYPDVRLGDAREFGISAREVREGWLMARAHISFHEEYILKNYTFATLMNWREHAGRCERAWDALDNAMNGQRDKLARLAELDRLRRIIGDKAYHARIMPPACPGYLFAND